MTAIVREAKDMEIMQIFLYQLIKYPIYRKRQTQRGLTDTLQVNP
ncbi:MAG: hypothetical protein K1060chlam2_00262 [Chlamydiae bacterium]|nr:hypothetical protein [Chlamydiota bacterium]